MVFLCYWWCLLLYRSFKILWGPICWYLILQHKPLLFCSGIFSTMPISSRLFPTFSSIKLSVSDFMWRSLIHLHLSFVQGEKNSPPYFWVSISHWTWTVLVWLDWPECNPQDPLCLHLSNTGATGMCHCEWYFMGVLGIEQSSSCVSEQIISQTEPSP